jgi:imidazolonepropionase-like amidohydrolase
MMTAVSRIARLCALLVAFSGFAAVLARAQDTAAQTLLTNVHVFDGKAEKRIMNANVLIEGNLIKQVSPKPISTKGATVIDGGGRTLMPGMIEAHGHVTYASPLPAMLLQQDAN